MPSIATSLTRVNSAPLVGAHFHPPAKLILSWLRAGTALKLRREPDNPFDSNAIGVWVHLMALPYDVQIDVDALAGYGFSIEDLLQARQLGHIAAKTGEAAIIAPLLDAGEEPTATLGFDMRGIPTVKLDWSNA
jgi:hypothetical protein